MIYCAVTNAANGVANFTLNVRPIGGVWTPKWGISQHGVNDPASSTPLGVPIYIPGGSDIRLTCAVTADNTAVRAGFDLLGQVHPFA